jgi:hypothetical protein
MAIASSQLPAFLSRTGGMSTPSARFHHLILSAVLSSPSTAGSNHSKGNDLIAVASTAAVLRFSDKCRPAPPRRNGGRIRISIPLAGRIKLVRRFRTARIIHLVPVLLDGWCGRLLTAGTGKNGAVLDALFARGITRRIAGTLARANRRRVVWTRLPVLVGTLGQCRRSARDDCGCEGDCNVYSVHDRFPRLG